MKDCSMHDIEWRTYSTLVFAGDYAVCCDDQIVLAERMNALFALVAMMN